MKSSQEFTIVNRDGDVHVSPGVEVDYSGKIYCHGESIATVGLGINAPLVLVRSQKYTVSLLGEVITVEFITLQGNVSNVPVWPNIPHYEIDVTTQGFSYERVEFNKTPFTCDFTINSRCQRYSGNHEIALAETFGAQIIDLSQDEETKFDGGDLSFLNLNPAVIVGSTTTKFKIPEKNSCVILTNPPENFTVNGKSVNLTLFSEGQSSQNAGMYFQDALTPWIHVNVKEGRLYSPMYTIFSPLSTKTGVPEDRWIKHRFHDTVTVTTSQNNPFFAVSNELAGMYIIADSNVFKIILTNCRHVIKIAIGKLVIQLENQEIIHATYAYELTLIDDIWRCRDKSQVPIFAPTEEMLDQLYRYAYFKVQCDLHTRLLELSKLAIKDYHGIHSNKLMSRINRHNKEAEKSNKKFRFTMAANDDRYRQIDRSLMVPQITSADWTIPELEQSSKETSTTSTDSSAPGGPTAPSADDRTDQWKYGKGWFSQ